MWYSEGYPHGKLPPQYNESGYHSFAEASLGPTTISPKGIKHTTDDGSPLTSNQRWAQYKEKNQQQGKEWLGSDQKEQELSPIHYQQTIPAADSVAQRRDQFKEDGTGSQIPSRKNQQVSLYKS